jgi:DNA-binding NarL/FixJ family response regulator
MKLLIVEDNAGVRLLIKSIAESMSDEICECSDGADALATYQLNRPDVVLMDIQMGDVDGIVATQRILAADPKAKVVMVTDYDQQDLREAASQAGACGYIVKENLLDLIRLIESF